MDSGEPESEQEQTEARARPEGPLSILLLMGQSNMAGRGQVAAEDQVHDPRLWMLSKDQQWVPAREPVHFDKPERAGVGPGLACGRALLAATADRSCPIRQIGLVPCAVGGTPLSRWVPGGDLYHAALARAETALASPEAGGLLAMLWHQGEADSATEELATTYADRWTDMVTDLRIRLKSPDLPVIAGGLGDFCLRHPDCPFAATVNTQLQSLPRRVSRTAFVDASGLVDGGDGIHFDAASARKLGQRYATALRPLLCD